MKYEAGIVRSNSHQHSSFAPIYIGISWSTACGHLYNFKTLASNSYMTVKKHTINSTVSSQISHLHDMRLQKITKLQILLE